ncbi:putative ribosome biogenesis protein RLP24 [Ciona intestinalis]|nr:probable ribosome biogenesis protein RLP24 [Ciona intestinalis]|eukprot:XP_002130745.1 probable ribosome biogenesis protein RLP24 [Ciona intestinalis]
MRIETCSFCSSPVYPGHGTCFVRNDCKIFQFCRSKCHKAFKKKRNPRKVKWTKAYRRTRGKDLTNDASLEFEKKRNCPIKYDRQVWEKTVKAIQRIDEIKTKRHNQFIMNRLKVGKKVEKEADIREVKKNINLIKSPAAGLIQRREEEQIVEVMPEENQQMEEV